MNAITRPEPLVRVQTARYKQAETRLRLHTRILESMTEGVSVADEQGVLIYTRPAEDAMFGYAPGELIGQYVGILNDYPPEENAAILSR